MITQFQYQYDKKYLDNKTQYLNLKNIVQYGGNNNILFMYGSATGNAKKICEQMHKEITQKCDTITPKYTTSICELNDWKKHNFFETQITIIVCSTTGDGEAPENANRFMTTLRKENRLLEKIKNESERLLQRKLAGKYFTILALGDTNYSKFCAAGKNINKFMTNLGATSFYKMGQADDGVGLSIVVEPWKAGLWNALKDLITTKLNKEIDLVSASPASPVNVESISTKFANVEHMDEEKKEDLSGFKATIINHERIFGESDQVFNIIRIQSEIAPSCKGYMTIKIYNPLKNVYSDYTIGFMQDDWLEIIVSYKESDSKISCSTYLHSMFDNEAKHILVKYGKLHHVKLGIDIFTQKEYLLMLTGTAVSIALNILQFSENINNITLIIGIRGTAFYEYIIENIRKYSDKIKNIFVALSTVESIERLSLHFNDKQIVLKKGRIPELLCECSGNQIDSKYIFDFVRQANAKPNDINYDKNKVVFIAGLDKLINWAKLTVAENICSGGDKQIICSF